MKMKSGAIFWVVSLGLGVGIPCLSLASIPLPKKEFEEVQSEIARHPLLEVSKNIDPLITSIFPLGYQSEQRLLSPVETVTHQAMDCVHGFHQGLRGTPWGKDPDTLINDRVREGSKRVVQYASMGLKSGDAADLPEDLQKTFSHVQRDALALAVTQGKRSALTDQLVKKRVDQLVMAYSNVAAFSNLEQLRWSETLVNQKIETLKSQKLQGIVGLTPIFQEIDQRILTAYKASLSSKEVFEEISTREMYEWARCNDTLHLGEKILKILKTWRSEWLTYQSYATALQTFKNKPGTSFKDVLPGKKSESFKKFLASCVGELKKRNSQFQAWDTQAAKSVHEYLEEKKSAEDSPAILQWLVGLKTQAHEEVDRLCFGWFLPNYCPRPVATMTAEDHEVLQEGLADLRQLMREEAAQEASKNRWEKKFKDQVQSYEDQKKLDQKTMRVVLPLNRKEMHVVPLSSSFSKTPYFYDQQISALKLQTQPYTKKLFTIFPDEDRKKRRTEALKIIQWFEEKDGIKSDIPNSIQTLNSLKGFSGEGAREAFMNKISKKSLTQVSDFYARKASESFSQGYRAKALAESARWGEARYHLNQWELESSIKYTRNDNHADIYKEMGSTLKKAFLWAYEAEATETFFRLAQFYMNEDRGGSYSRGFEGDKLFNEQYLNLAELLPAPEQKDKKKALLEAFLKKKERNPSERLIQFSLSSQNMDTTMALLKLNTNLRSHDLSFETWQRIRDQLRQAGQPFKEQEEFAFGAFMGLGCTGSSLEDKDKEFKEALLRRAAFVDAITKEGYKLLPSGGKEDADPTKIFLRGVDQESQKEVDRLSEELFLKSQQKNERKKAVKEYLLGRLKALKGTDSVNDQEARKSLLFLLEQGLREDAKAALKKKAWEGLIKEFNLSRFNSEHLDDFNRKLEYSLLSIYYGGSIEKKEVTDIIAAHQEKQEQIQKAQSTEQMKKNWEKVFTPSAENSVSAIKTYDEFWEKHQDTKEFIEVSGTQIHAWNHTKDPNQKAFLLHVINKILGKAADEGRTTDNAQREWINQYGFSSKCGLYTLRNLRKSLAGS